LHCALFGSHPQIICLGGLRCAFGWAPVCLAVQPNRVAGAKMATDSQIVTKTIVTSFCFYRDMNESERNVILRGVILHGGEGSCDNFCRPFVFFKVWHILMLGVKHIWEHSTPASCNQFNRLVRRDSLMTPGAGRRSITITITVNIQIQIQFKKLKTSHTRATAEHLPIV